MARVVRRRRFWAVLAASMTVVLVGATGVIGLPVSPVGSPGAANNL